MTEEGKLQAKIIDALEKMGHLVIKIMRANKSGIPDLLVLLTNGRYMMLEVKSAKGVASKLQLYYIEEVKKRKGCAFLCYSVEDAVTMANNLTAVPRQ